MTTTTFLALYFAINIAVAFLLDRKRFRVALIAHLVMFVLMSFFVLVCSGAQFVSQALVRLFGEEGFKIFVSALAFGDTQLLLPIVIVQLLLTVQVVLLFAACTCEVVRCFQVGKPKRQANVGNSFTHSVRANTTRPFPRKLCYLHQSLLC